ncbi:hypothetical protein VP141O351_P0031 [Vibrio phage 141O35-1]|nr:hypothetical protein VP141O351_P0031 [Vibrio phage 141O35-1]
MTVSSVEFTLTYSFLAASGSGPVLTAALELMWLLTGFEPACCAPVEDSLYHLATVTIIRVARRNVISSVSRKLVTSVTR